jgi:TfoX/Sxy family transcriptional regulator of competence genes
MKEVFMAYDEKLAARVSAILANTPNLTEKVMFGGVGYMLSGNMACGVHKDYLIVRVGPDGYQEALNAPHTKVFDITGRPMRGWVMVAPEGCASEEGLKSWVRKGVDFALTLPSK